MASELVRNVWCDVHATDTEERVSVPPEGEGVRLVVGLLTGTVDLCEECLTNYLKPMAEWVERYSRPADQTPAPTPKPSGKTRFVCKVCGSSYEWQNSLRQHEREKHGIPATGGPAGGPVDCPHCGRTLGTAAALALHIKASHPEHWTGPKRKN